MSARPEDGTITVIAEVVQAIGRLVKGELRLARAEAVEGLKTAGGGIAKIAVAAIVAVVGLNVLAGAAVAGLAAAGLGPAWGALVVGAVLMIVALLLVMAGKAALRPKVMYPDRALRGVRRDVDTLRAGLSGAHSEKEA